MAEGSEEVVPKDDREVSFALEVSTGEMLASHGLPSAKLSTTYTRRWRHRGQRFFERTLKYAGTDENGLTGRIESDEPFADTIAAAGQRAILVGDEKMQDWLARLVAAAFRDDARVDTAAFLINLLTQLEPVHLRALRTLWPLQGKHYSPEDGVGAESRVYEAALLRLASLGLVEEKASQTASRSNRRTWAPTTLGIEMLELCEGVDRRALDALEEGAHMPPRRRSRSAGAAD
jgi:hypothetical protein